MQGGGVNHQKRVFKMDRDLNSGRPRTHAQNNNQMEGADLLSGGDTNHNDDDHGLGDGGGMMESFEWT